MDGNILADANCTYNGRDTVVTLLAESPSGSEVVIDLGVNPQLTVRDYSETIGKLLLGFQTTIELKDRMWEIIQAKQPTTVKASRLLSLSLDKVFLGPILELLLADSRS